MPGSSAVVQPLARSSVGWLAAARERRSAQGPVPAPGTAGAAATGKKDIQYPAETRLTFTTQTAVAVK
jgi:hypothetical protein